MDNQANAGYLGLRVRTIELDQKLTALYGPSILVIRSSPAAKAGLRSGDYIRSINDLSYEEYHRAMPPVGTLFEIHIWRRGVGELRFAGVLEKPPKERRKEEWEQRPATMPGRPVRKDERPVFMDFISKDPGLKLDVRYLTVLLNHDGYLGIYPKRRTLAKELSCSLSTVSRCQRRCIHRGVLEVFSGKRRRTSNTYVVSWPQDHGRSRQERPVAEDEPQASEQARLVANDLLRVARLHRIARALKEAPGIVAEWFARGWKAEIISRVIREQMEHGSGPRRSLRYFEKAIAKAHGE